MPVGAVARQVDKVTEDGKDDPHFKWPWALSAQRRVQIRSEGMNTRPQKAVQTHCIRPGRPIYSPPHSFPFLPRSLPQMEHHPSTPAKPVTDIPLENVPPLYGGGRAPLSLNIIVVGAGIDCLAAAHTLP